MSIQTDHSGQVLKYLALLQGKVRIARLREVSTVRLPGRGLAAPRSGLEVVTQGHPGKVPRNGLVIPFSGIFCDKILRAPTNLLSRL